MVMAWKSETTKECVTTRLPNQLALKMDGTKGSCLYSAIRVNSEALTSGRAYGCGEAFVVNLGETATSTDLGGSTKYSNENFGDRKGKSFHGNSS